MAEDTSSISDLSSLYTVVVVGTTGVGKSSLLTLFCGKNKVKCSSGAESHTIDSEIFKDVELENRLWMDSQGADDSKQDETDEQILVKVLRKIHDSKIDSVKIVWVVEKKERMSNTLKIQANFIKSFNNNDNDKNIWNSCLIIVKEGSLKPEQDAQGALAAASVMGACNSGIKTCDGIMLGNVQNIGFTCLEWLSKNNSIYRMSQKIDDITRIECGYLHEEEIQKNINDRLENLETVQVIFRNKKCEKCGVMGDPRCIPVECHPASEKYHTKEVKKYHPEGQEDYHLVTILEDYHSNPVLKSYHTGITKWYHPMKGRVKYHPEEDSFDHKSGSCSYHLTQSTEKKHIEGLEYYHDGTLIEKEKTKIKKEKRCPKHEYSDFQERVVAWGSYICERCSNTLKKGSEMYHCSKCCDNSSHSGSGSRTGQCDGYYCYMCLGEKQKEVTISEGNVYSCCGSSTPTGCRQRYACCPHLPISAEGCEEFYRCCGEKVGSKGCQGKYNCCNQPSGTKGCSYTCCYKKIGSSGCEKKYMCCAVDVTTNSVGCEQKFSCCGQDLGSKGCSYKYECCGHGLGSTGCDKRYRCCQRDDSDPGCHKKWLCCGDDVQNRSKGCEQKWGCCGAPFKDDGCKTRCVMCERDWGTAPGCDARSVLSKHQMVSIDETKEKKT